MPFLAVASLLWIGAHLGIAGGSARTAIVRRTGEAQFLTIFSVLSAALITLLIVAYTHAPTIPLWATPDSLRWLLLALMLPAFVLFCCAALARNPTAVGGAAALTAEPRGIVRVTRHPMLWSFALWAAVHLAGNGDAASLVFFGAFLVTALAGMPSIDAKIARRDPAAWQTFAGRTSIIPFAAIAAGRNRLALGEIGALPIVAGVVVWGVVAYAHPWIFGVAVVPR